MAEARGARPVGEGSMAERHRRAARLVDAMAPPQARGSMVDRHRPRSAMADETAMAGHEARSRRGHTREAAMSAPQARDAMAESPPPAQSPSARTKRIVPAASEGRAGGGGFSGAGKSQARPTASLGRDRALSPADWAISESRDPRLKRTAAVCHGRRHLLLPAAGETSNGAHKHFPSTGTKQAKGVQTY